MSKHLQKTAAIIALLGCHLTATAEDIDLFVGANPSSSTEVPNVLFIVDNTANWNTAFTNEIAALANTLAGLPVDKFRIGIMFAAETGGGNSNVDGGYVRAAMRLMDSANKTKYQALVNSLDKIADKGNGGASSLVMAEAYRYFSGGAPYGGTGKVKADYTGNVLASASAASKAVWALPGNALPSFNSATYNSPITSGCQKNYIIYISNGPSQDNNSVISQATSMLSAAGGSTTQIPISPSGSQTNVSDEWARFMKQNSLNVVTYTIDVNPTGSGQGPGWTAILKSMANVSGGIYTSVSTSSGSTALENTMNKYLSEIQSVNTVFAAVSLPVSVNTQGTYLNQVFVGMFRPDANRRPRWAGNLKQYKMGMSGDTLQLQDADGLSAINSQTGFVAECARSFWTPNTVDSYWTFRPQGACIPPTGSSADLYMNSNYPDGNVVEKGAQAYKGRSSTSRNVKTCSPTFASCTALTSFDTSNAAITQALLSASDSSERDALINWARGQDIDDENTNGTTTTEMRASLHGDVVHSRPIALNFGSDASPQVVVFYGGNDGILRAVNGNRTAAIGGTAAGAELWSFVAPEFYSKIKRIRDNTDPVSTPSLAGTPKPYGIDGAMTAYKTGSSTWLYATMRRGGRALYAFDVSTPSTPSLKWKVGCPTSVDDTGCTGGFDGIGQTWSSAKTLKASGYNGGASALVIIGGGYDVCEDSDPHTCTAASKGNKIFVLDADTGARQATLPTTRSVVGDITIARDKVTGLAKYAYATDTGGNIYRITIGTSAPGDWTITPIASLGCDTPGGCTATRKFMFAPDVVEENGVYYIMVGSGDREKPLTTYASAYSTANYFFMVKDKPSDPTWLSSEAANCENNNVICKNSLLAIPSNSNPTTAALAAKKGWYLPLATHEQVVTSSVTLVGVVTFSTHTPTPVAAGSCGANLGIANVYNIHYTDASPADGNTRYQRISGDGLPPSPVGGKVTLDDGRTVPFVIGSKPNSPLEARQPDLNTTSKSNQMKSRVYWHIQQ